jgi:hypothetical protein
MWIRQRLENPFQKDASGVVTMTDSINKIIDFLVKLVFTREQYFAWKVEQMFSRPVH